MSLLATDVKKPNIKLRIAVFGFGRFQPPTKGHLDLIENIIKESEKKKLEKPGSKVDSYLFSSLSHNKLDQKYSDDFSMMMEKNIFCATSKNSNPIPYIDKFHTMIDYQNINIWPKNITIVNSLDPQYNDGTKNKNFKGKIVNVAAIISFLYDRYDKIYFVIGSDRYVKGSFDEFFNKGLLEIIPTMRNESVISGTMARVQALQYFFKTITKTGEEIEKLYDEYGKTYLGFDDSDMVNIFSPKPGQLTQSNIVEFIINQIVNYTIPETMASKFKDMTISWNPKEQCGKWGYKWTSPESWNAYWRRGRGYYPTRTRTKSDQMAFEQDQKKVDSKIKSEHRGRIQTKLEEANQLMEKKIMPEYDPNNPGEWQDAYNKKESLKKTLALAHVTDLRARRYELDRKINIPKDFDLKNVMINTSENITVDLRIDKIAVWTFGRFQPPHIAHDKLIDTVVDIADYLPMKNVDAYVFTSQKSNKYNDPRFSSLLKKYIRTNEYKTMLTSSGSDRYAGQDNIFQKNEYNENPLHIPYKLKLLKKLHGKKYKNTINNKSFVVNVQREGIYTPYDALNHLIKLGYNKLFFVIGKDREKNFEPVIKYGKDKGISVYLVAKDRLESQVSGTKVRNYALSNDFDKVKSSLLQNELDTRLIDKDINTLIKNIQDNIFVNEERLKKLDDDIGREKRLKEYRKTRKKSTTGGGKRKKKTRKKRGGMEAAAPGNTTELGEPEEEQAGEEMDEHTHWSAWKSMDYLKKPDEARVLSIYNKEDDWFFRRGAGGWGNKILWKRANPIQVRFASTATGRVDYNTSMIHTTAAQLYQQGWRIYNNEDGTWADGGLVVVPEGGGGMKNRKKKTRKRYRKGKRTTKKYFR
jgi:nicotinic acid mononucleotide adenylyltransferase